MWATMLPVFTHVCEAGVACWRQLPPVATDKTCIVVAAFIVVLCVLLLDINRPLECRARPRTRMLAAN